MGRTSGADDELVVHRMRTHALALMAPTLLLITTGAAAGAATALLPSRLLDGLLDRTVLVAAVGGAIVVCLVIAPFLRWWCTTYTVTTHRLIVRRGVLNRTGHQVPLTRILDVSSHRSLLDRILGRGTLIVRTAADTDPLELADVPDVAAVHDDLTELVIGARDLVDEPPGR